MDVSIEKLFKAVDSKDSVSFASFLTEDAVFRLGNAPAVIGKDLIQETFRALFASVKSLKHELIEVIEQGQTCVVYGNATYTRHDDTILRVPFANVFHMTGWLIKDYWVYIDASELYLP